MSFSRGGKTQTSTSSNATNINTPVNLQDTSGIAIGQAGGAVTVNATDFGAINAALAAGIDFQEGANDATRDALAYGESVFSTVENALGRVGSAYENAADVQSEALGAVSDLADRSSSRIAQISEGAINATSEAASNFFDRALNFAASLSAKQQSSLSDTVTALNAVAVESSKSTDQRVAELAEGSQKTILIALGIAVTGVLGFVIFRRA
jgi:hypothetical protein